MTNVETQTSQRTVVAFISGLLIGGLLVWIFSATPDEKKQNEDTTKTDTAEKASTETATASQEEASATTSDSPELSVTDQKAGATVTLGTVTYPNKSGWVVIRDAQGVLGASRFDVAAGLQPTTIELLRPTFAGTTYEAVFYTNEGTIGFNLAEDKLVDGISTKFAAN